MSSNKYEYLRNVVKGRTDWKIKVRIIRQWRGTTKTGEPYKGYNLLLLDAHNNRMQAFVPTFLESKIQRMLEVKKIYAINMFQVKEFTADDKWRSIHMDRQILFTNQTKSREIPENELFIPNNMFDFFEFSQLASLAKQNVYLADVVGVIMKRDPLTRKTNRHGKEQWQVRMKISDGRTQINVTLWDQMAEQFQKEMNRGHYEEPIILIIASGRVSEWKDEIDMCNYSPTVFYINYNHHSVAQLRKMCQQNKFTGQNQLQTTRKEVRLLSVEEIKKLTHASFQDEVICQVKIDTVEEVPVWYYSVCTSCYQQIKLIDDVHVCEDCKRPVPEPDKKFGICILASDKTGSLGIVLMDRPVRTLFGKTVFEIEEECKDAYPKVMKTLKNGEYTIKLKITKENIDNKNDYYLATDIFLGFTFQKQFVAETSIYQPAENSVNEPSGTTYHLDEISTLNAGT